MILYQLLCHKGHDFEAWFCDSGTYDQQVVAGDVACPFCGTSVVTKAPMAPHVATGRGKGGKNRRADILRAAGTLMAAKGYDATSMRDISASVGMLPGSVYYHFPSKEALFVELHKDVVQAMTARVREAVEGVSDPWERLRLSARAHLEGLTQNDNLVAIVSPQFIRDQTEVAKVVTDHRREYEQIFRDIFAALDLP